MEQNSEDKRKRGGEMKPKFDCEEDYWVWYEEKRTEQIKKDCKGGCALIWGSE